MNDELFVKLRDCFTAGYTLPQYCIDNGIKRPLFVSEKKYELFIWQVYVQFHYILTLRRTKRSSCRLSGFRTTAKLKSLAESHGSVFLLRVEKSFATICAEKILEAITWLIRRLVINVRTAAHR